MGDAAALERHLRDTLQAGAMALGGPPSQAESAANEGATAPVAGVGSGQAPAGGPDATLSPPRGTQTAGNDGFSALDALAPARAQPKVMSPPLPLYDFRAMARARGDDYAPPKTGIAMPMMWPSPRHVHYNPPQPEPLAEVKESLAADMQRRDAQRTLRPENVMNRIVYDCVDPSPHAPSHPAREPGTVQPWYHPATEDDRTLVFESRFESGNLRRAVQVYEHEYDLILKPDVNTRGHTQWFYFSVSNTRRHARYKFNIINLIKGDSLYNQGMRPLVYSCHDAERRGVGWVRAGDDVCYYQNNIRRKGGFYYTATFTLSFPHSLDTVYVAYCYPYTYTDLRRYLAALESDPKRRSRFRRRTLCSTLAGNDVDLLTITSFSGDSEALKARRGVVVTGRVHPGESNASYMMKGFIDYLTGPSLDAKILRDNFVFKVVPMLNPDGVVVGNYRCSLAGTDLNRSWADPSSKLHPTVFHTKQMISRFSESREVTLCVDLHGHSRKMNIFMYGCENQLSSLRLREQVFPRLLWQNTPYFSFADCNFKVQKAKESTARVVTWRSFSLVNSYTMEASFAGANYGRYKGCHFTCAHFEAMGHYCCDTILDYCDPDQSKVATALRELQLLFPARGTASSATAPEDDSDGSDFGDTTESDAKRKLKRRGKRSAKASKSAKSSASGSNGSARRGRNKGTTPSNSSGRRRSDATAARRAKKRGGGSTSGTNGASSQGSARPSREAAAVMAAAAAFNAASFAMSGAQSMTSPSSRIAASSRPLATHPTAVAAEQAGLRRAASDEQAGAAAAEADGGTGSLRPVRRSEGRGASAGTGVPHSTDTLQRPSQHRPSPDAATAPAPSDARSGAAQGVAAGAAPSSPIRATASRGDASGSEPGRVRTSPPPHPPHPPPHPPAAGPRLDGRRHAPGPWAPTAVPGPSVRRVRPSSATTASGSGSRLGAESPSAVPPRHQTVARLRRGLPPAKPSASPLLAEPHGSGSGGSDGPSPTEDAVRGGLGAELAEWTAAPGARARVGTTASGGAQRLWAPAEGSDVGSGVESGGGTPVEGSAAGDRDSRDSGGGGYSSDDEGVADEARTATVRAPGKGKVGWRRTRWRGGVGRHRSGEGSDGAQVSGTSLSPGASRGHAAAAPGSLSMAVTEVETDDDAEVDAPSAAGGSSPVAQPTSRAQLASRGGSRRRVVVDVDVTAFAQGDVRQSGGQ